jgi:DNA-binding winged helix-turn-helix (wHTH) protein
MKIFQKWLYYIVICELLRNLKLIWFHKKTVNILSIYRRRYGLIKKNELLIYVYKEERPISFQ